jgi:hypothetical protein
MLPSIRPRRFFSLTASYRKRFMKNPNRPSRRAERVRLAVRTLESRIVPAVAVAVTPANALIRFDTSSPTVIQRTTPLTGLQGGDKIAGIDFRATTGQLFGLAIRNTPGPDEGRIYRIEPASGACTLLGSSTFSTTLADGAFYAFEVDPVHDTLRIMNSASQNVSVSLTTGGLLTTGTAVHFGGNNSPASIVGLAYLGGLNPPTPPLQELFGIESSTNSLVRFGSLQTSDEDHGDFGVLAPLGVTPTNGNIGFDYLREPRLGFATIPTAGGTGLYSFSVNGTPFTLVGIIGGTTSAGLNGFALSPTALASIRAVAAGPGGAPIVRAYDTFTGALKFEFLAYDAAFHGGVRVAIGDINGDGVPDIVTTPGPGGGPHVRVFDGRDGTNLPGPGGNFFAYESTFTGGLFVACMENAASGQSQIVTMPDVGGGPLLKQFDNAGILVRAHYVYDPQSRRGAQLAVGDIDGDGFGDYVVAEGPGISSLLRVLSGAPATLYSELAAFQPYDFRFLGGVYLAAGNVTGDGLAEIITGAGESGGPHVRVFGQAPPRPIGEFLAYDPRFTGGVRVGVGDVNGDGRLDILTGPGPGGGPDVRGYDGATGAMLSAFLAFDSAFVGGVYVAGDPY